MQQMLDTDPTTRIQPKDILKHPWFHITSAEKLAEETFNPEFSSQSLDPSKLRFLSDREAMNEKALEQTVSMGYPKKFIYS